MAFYFEVKNALLNAHIMVLTGLFIAAGILLPIFFHGLGMGGAVFLPMHIPVLLGGLFLGWRPGLVIGLLTPALSCLLTGMPPLLPALPLMTAELSAYGAVAGLCSLKLCWNVYVALIAAMLAGRLAAALVLACFADLLGIHLTPLAYIAASISHGLVGIVIQLAFIPFIVKKLQQFIPNL